MKDDVPTADRGPEDLTQAALDAMYAAKLRGEEILTPIPLTFTEADELERKSGLSPGAIIPEDWDGTPVNHMNARGWCAPSRCAVGVCLLNEEHDPGCAGAGSAYRTLDGAFFDGLHMISTPEITVRRGGIRFQRFPVHTVVKKIGWRKFYVQIRVHGQSHHELIGPFKKRDHATNAQKVIDTMARMLDELWYQETKISR